MDVLLKRSRSQAALEKGIVHTKRRVRIAERRSGAQEKVEVDMLEIDQVYGDDVAEQVCEAKHIAEQEDEEAYFESSYEGQSLDSLVWKPKRHFDFGEGRAALDFQELSGTLAAQTLVASIAQCMRQQKREQPSRPHAT